MSAPPFKVGDFVWCKFPLSENPTQPGLEHIAYTMGVSGVPAVGPTAFVAYTTSRMQPDPLPQGVIRFDDQNAAEMGHAKQFLLNAGRIAAVPINPAYFPYLNEPGHGVIGRAPKCVQAAVAQAAKDLLTRRPEAIQRLGPLWPKSR